VAEILQKFACRDPQCAWHQYATRASGTTRCPVCQALSLRIERRDGGISITMSCLCPPIEVSSALRNLGIDFSRVQR
jgi:hypothetical protein